MPKKTGNKKKPKKAEIPKKILTQFKSKAFDTLTDKQKLFVIELVKCNFNQAQAYVKTYGKETEAHARMNASRLLTNANIKKAAQELINKVLESHKMTLEKKIVETYMSRAFYDPSEIIDKDGQLIVDDLKDLPKDCRMAIEGIEKYTTLQSSNGETKTIRYKIKLANREKALEMLSRYMKIMNETFDVKEQLTIVMGTKKKMPV